MPFLFATIDSNIRTLDYDCKRSIFKLFISISPKIVKITLIILLAVTALENNACCELGK